MRRAASMPSSFGIFTSMIARSGSSDSARATASSPSRASPTTSIPARFSSSTRSSRMIVSSSATRIRMRGGYPARSLHVMTREPSLRARLRRSWAQTSRVLVEAGPEHPALVRPEVREVLLRNRSAAPPRCRRIRRAGGRTCTLELHYSASPSSAREHPRVPVGVVERRELHHAVDLVRVAVELVSSDSRCARGVDVLDGERRHGAAVLELLALAEPDRDAVQRRAHFAPAVLSRR